MNKLTKGSNMRWESSRMTLPEHVEKILSWQNEQAKVNKPIIDEQQWAEFGRTITEAKEMGCKIEIVAWSNGAFESITGYIHNIDPQLKRIRLDIDDHDIRHINFNDIVNVKSG